MSFESWVIAICDRFVSQRTFDLVVVPALADLDFEEASGRRSRLASRAAVIRAIAGGVAHDMRRGSGGFLVLTLLSACYYLLPDPGVGQHVQDLVRVSDCVRRDARYCR